jgi:nucleoside-diphosphate-sugar epimerase
MDHLGNDIKKPVVLVTGGAGYLGQEIIKQLKSPSNCNIAVVQGLTQNGIDYDLTREDQIDQVWTRYSPDTVIHCAAQVPKSFCEYDNNTAGEVSLKMVKNILAKKPKKIIFISSMTVYPNIKHRLAYTEDALLPDQLIGYAKYKRLAELSIIQNRQLTGYCILRLPGLFGQNRKSGVLYNYLHSIRSGHEFELSEGLPHWSTIHVLDAAEAVANIYTKSSLEQKEILNIAYSGPMSIPAAINQLAVLLGVEPQYVEPEGFQLDIQPFLEKYGGCFTSFEEQIQRLVWDTSNEPGQHIN